MENWKTEKASDRLIIWQPEGNYKDLLRTFCAMRDHDLLGIQSIDYPVTTYELEIKCDRQTFESHLKRIF
jgi:hypothetical protein